MVDQPFWNCTTKYPSFPKYISSSALFFPLFHPSIYPSTRLSFRLSINSSIQTYYVHIKIT